MSPSDNPEVSDGVSVAYFRLGKKVPFLLAALNMSNMSSFIWLSLLLNSQLGMEDTQQMLQEATKANAAYRARIVNGCRFNLSLTGSQKTPTGSKILSSSKNEIHLAASRWIKETTPDNDKTNWPVVARGFNPQYGFELQNHSPNPEWSLFDLSLDKPLHPLLKKRTKQLAQLSPGELVTHGLLPFLEVEGIPCERLFTHPSFRATRAVRDGKRIRFDFESDVQSFSGPDRLLRGSLWLLPDSSWVVDEYQITIFSANAELPVDMKMEWRDLVELPEPVKARNDYHQRAGLISWEYRFSDWILGKEPPERFTLSYYGLPEPKGIKQPEPPRIWLWLLVTAVGAGLLAILFAWLKRRHAAAAQPKT